MPGVERRTFPDLRHELHNEPEGPAIVDDVIAWLRRAMRLTVLETRLTVCRLPADGAIPAWVDGAGDFVSITRTADELSIVAASDAIPADLPQEGPWRAFKVQGPLVMTLIGVVAAIADPLRDAGIAIFAISSFDTDYVLSTSPTSTPLVATLTAAGHEIG